MDTSAVIKYLNHDFPQTGMLFIDGFIDTDCTISFITEIELLAWNPVNPANVLVYEEFVERAEILQINTSLIVETIRIRKNYHLKIPDAIIAATAIVFNRVLVADNDSDFRKVPTLQYLNPRLL